MSIRAELREWKEFIPIPRREIFYHILLFIDCMLILFRVSYETLIPDRLNYGLLGFDFIISAIWAISFYGKVRKKDDKWNYIKDRWYHIAGLIPFPIFRLLLLLSTLKLIILVYKFIKRGEKNREEFLDKELHFRFQDIIVDTISDAIFLRSLQRVEEVVQRMEFDKISREILKSHRQEIQKMVSDSLNTKPFMKQLNTMPFFAGVTSQLSKDITEMMIETMENEVLGKIMKDMNLYVLKEMDNHVRQLDLDRITDSPENT